MSGSTLTTRFAAPVLVRRLWHSATFTTWSSTAVRSLSVVLVLPLLLRELTAPEIAAWYLLSTIMSLQALADLGFAPTFSRLIAQAMGGGTEAGALPTVAREGVAPPAPNWMLVESIWSAMRTVYWRVTAVAIVLLGTFGTWALVRPMNALPEPGRGWLAWWIVLAVSGVALWANVFAVYLQGLNQVARFRRWEAITSFGSIVTSVVVLLLGGRLLALVAANQAWLVVNVFRNWQLARIVAEGRFKTFRRTAGAEAVMRAAWPAAWRSGLGVSFSRGVLYASGLIYAQIAGAAALGTYLLAFRAIQLVTELSQAPFYSKLPTLAGLRASGRFAEQLTIAQRAMRIAYWTYAAGFVGIGVTGASLLQAIESQVPFADARLWALLGIGFFLERYGAMHIQLYSTTNRIVWHIATGVTGTIYLAVSLSLLGRVGVEAFPIAVIAGNLGFYCWYSARHVYRMFNTDFFAFERTTLLPPAMVIGLYAMIKILR